MRYQVPFQIAGPTGGHKSIQFGGELSRNIYIDKVGDRVGAHDFPGLKSLGTDPGVDRGFAVMDGVLYKLNGSTLYSVSSAGVYTSLGSVPGTGRAVFADDGANLFIVTGGVIYHYDGATISTVTQSVVSNPSSIDYMNRQFIITGDDGLFATSAVGDGTSWDELNYAEEETAPDALIRCYVFNQVVYMMGGKTVVPWYNSGTGNPPFDRQETALVNFGIAGVHAVTNTDNYLYWLSDDRKVIQCVGSSARNIAPPGVAHMIDGFDSVDGAIFSTCYFDGQTFVICAFGGGSKTICYSETLDYWVELASGTDPDSGMWYGSEAIRCYGKTLVSDYRNGNVYELDQDTYTDNGEARLRIRVTQSFMGNGGRMVTFCGARVTGRVGVGLASGQGSDPVLMCALSNDGGHTWGEQIDVELGEMGDYTRPIQIDGFTTGYNVRLRIMCSDPVPLSLWEGVATMRDAGY